MGRPKFLLEAIENALGAPTTGVLARVAASIARPGRGSAFTIDAANAKDDDLEPVAAAMTGRAFAVWARTDLFFVDIDFHMACERHPGTAIEQVEDLIATYVQELVWSIEMAGSTALVCASGGAGCFHVFAAGLIPETAERLVELGSRQGLIDLAHSHVPGRPEMAIRPPGAPHRSGTTFSRPLFVEDWDEVLRALEAPSRAVASPAPSPEPFVTSSGRQPRSNPVRGGAPRPLSRPYRVLLDTGDADAFVAAGGHLPRGAPFSLSEVLWRLLLAAVNAGYELEEFVSLCEGGEKPGAAKLKKERADRGPRRWTDWLVGDWNRAVRFVEEHPSDGGARLSPEVRAIIRAYAQSKWSGRGAGTRKAILRAMISMAVVRNNDVIFAAIRPLQKKAKVASSGTVSQDLVALERDGWIEKVGCRQQPDRAQRWRVKVPTSLDSGIGIASAAGSPGCETICSVSLREDLHEVWCEDGLGHAAWLVWDVLARQGPATTATLEELTGQKGPALRQHLRSLEGVGLARKDKVGKEYLWTPQDRPDLDAIARRLGVAGFLERLRDRQAEERAAFSKFTNPVRRLMPKVRSPRPRNPTPLAEGVLEGPPRRTRRKRADLRQDLESSSATQPRQ